MIVYLAIAGISLVGLIVAILYSFRTVNSLNKKIAELSSENARLETVNIELRQKAELLEQLRTERDETIVSLKEATTQLQSKNEQIDGLSQNLKNQNAKIDELQNQITSSKESLATVRTTLVEEKKQSEEKLELLEDSKEKLKLEFQNLANKIFDAKSEKLTTSSKESLDAVLKPLKEQLTQFKARVNVIYDKESEERGFLKKEIADLKELNNRISKDALNLTSALKGDKKTQGNWGEIQLESLLEYSGLIDGIEYELQPTHKDDEGDIYRPDAVIHLPQKRDIVIDSKVSLVDYTNYFSTDETELKEVALKGHIKAIRNHISQLSSKSYQKLPGINTLEYVIMFLPIEAAYITAIKEDPDLLKFALSKNISLICPSTLLITLQTIHNIWNYEKQSKNAKEIAEQGQRIYDKFAVFTESYKKIGNSLKSANENYESGIKQLVSGRGNLVSGFEKLKELGVQPKKNVDASLIEKAEASGLIEAPEEIQAEE
ncbi:MAG: DNA recombination protein RmuC [Candidatus Zophobacter franzmannii]|nr:DNA recombination protein RmuC [Candidatus Zophobacter franzmannii]